MAQPLVLIVEDNPETRHFYGECFARGGFSTKEAHNGHQALAMALALPPPHVIVTDTAVPGLDATDLWRDGPRARARRRPSAARRTIRAAAPAPPPLMRRVCARGRGHPSTSPTAKNMARRAPQDSGCSPRARRTDGSGGLRGGFR